LNIGPLIYTSANKTKKYILDLDINYLMTLKVY